MRETGILVVLAVAFAGPVRAQPGPAAIDEAERLFDEARKLLAEQRDAEACDKFGKSFELGHIIGAELNLANCAERDGRLAAARRLFDAAASDAARQGDGERARFARAQADRLATRLATIVVTLAEPITAGVAVRIGDRELPPSREIREFVDPAAVEVVVIRPGLPVFRRTVDARADVTTTIEVPEIEGSTPAAPAAMRVLAPTVQRSRVPLLALGGSAIVLAAAGLGAWGWSASTYHRSEREVDDRKQQDLFHKAKFQYYVSQGLGAASVACAGAAIWLYFANVTISPMFAGDGTGFVVEGRY